MFRSYILTVESFYVVGANICGLSILKTNWGVSHGFEL